MTLEYDVSVDMQKIMSQIKRRAYSFHAREWKEIVSLPLEGMNIQE